MNKKVIKTSKSNHLLVFLVHQIIQNPIAFLKILKSDINNLTVMKVPLDVYTLMGAPK